MKKYLLSQIFIVVKSISPIIPHIEKTEINIEVQQVVRFVIAETQEEAISKFEKDTKGLFPEYKKYNINCVEADRIHTL